MEKRKNMFLMIAIISFLYFVLSSAPSGYADVLLDVPEIAQEHSQWCWAGSSQATLDYYQSLVSQCTIANWAFGMSYCCGSSVFDWNSSCNYWNYMYGTSPYGTSGSLQGILQHWGVNSNARTYALAQNTVVSEINAGRPFVIRFGWTSGGGHFLVGYGYDQNGNYLDYMDPWPGNGYTKSSYTWVVSASDHAWTHTLQITTPSPTPGVATLISPSGTIMTTTPTYTWNAVSNSTMYCLYVDDSSGNKINQWYTAAEAGCGSGTGTCSVTPTTDVGGLCRWYIRTSNAAGLGPWSAPLSFTVPPPSAATLVSPSGTIMTTTPTYTWNAVSNSSWYCLYVNDSTGNKINQWYTAASLGCGSGTCSVTPTTDVGGSCQWYVRTYNAAGYGSWSAPLSFTVPPPSAATLVSPSGTIMTTTLTYTWNAVSNSSWYCLYVNDSTGNKINQWYTAAQAGCGSGTCSVTPTTGVGGSCQWYVRTYNAAGYGPWSAPLSFTVPPPSAATLVSPSGTIATTAPVYTWDAVSNSSWYCLYVNDSTGNKINQWYTAAQAGCGSGIGTCSVTPTAEVLGSCQWYVRTYNGAGFGPWSAPLSFSTPNSPPPAATLVSPSGTITTTTPVYTWNAVFNSTWYCLYVNDSTGNKINQWYTAAQAGCGSGIGTCAVTPTTEVLGSCQWYVRTYNGAGLGQWSAPLSFSTPNSPPPAATLVSPSGAIGTNTPAYTWNAVSNSTWYCLYVNDSTGNRIQQWYSASAAGCASGTGTCSITPTTALASGAGQWYIRTYNAAGFGQWSAPLSFTVP